MSEPKYASPRLYKCSGDICLQDVLFYVKALSLEEAKAKARNANFHYVDKDNSTIINCNPTLDNMEEV